MKTGLLLIDFQKAFLHPSWGERNNPSAEENALKLLSRWRDNSWPVLHIQHTSERENSLFYRDSYGHQWKEGFEPGEGEPIFQKNVNSAFIGTNLKEYLVEQQISKLVVAGLTTPHCVSTSVRMAENYGFEVFLVKDATAAFELKGISAQTIYETELAILQDEFATIIETEVVLTNVFY